MKETILLEYMKTDITIHFLNANAVSRFQALRWLLPVIEEIIDKDEWVFEKRIEHPEKYTDKNGQLWTVELTYYNRQMDIIV